jgi:hypothetical protein
MELGVYNTTGGTNDALQDAFGKIHAALETSNSRLDMAKAQDEDSKRAAAMKAVKGRVVIPASMKNSSQREAQSQLDNEIRKGLNEAWAETKKAYDMPPEAAARDVINAAKKTDATGKAKDTNESLLLKKMDELRRSMAESRKK